MGVGPNAPYLYINKLAKNRPGAAPRHSGTASGTALETRFTPLHGTTEFRIGYVRFGALRGGGGTAWGALSGVHYYIYSESTCVRFSIAASHVFMCMYLA